MASKRQLKKEIILEVTQLFDEAIILRSLATGQSMELELEELMDDIMVLTDDSLRRVAHIAQHVADFSDRLDLFVEGIYGIKG